MSIKKVASIAGVSIATVSRYLNSPHLLKKETLEKVESAIKATNYQPNTLAQNFRRGKSRLIIVVVHNIGNPLYENLTLTMTKTAQLKGYDILIKETNHNNLPLEYYRDMLNSKQVDGLIIMVDLPKMSRETQLALQDLPIVLVKGEAVESTTNYQHIGFDNYEAAKTATNHLITLGHKTIACITHHTHHMSYAKRKAGFINAMESAQLDHAKSIISLHQNDHDNIEKAISKLHSIKTKPTAIFCIDDDIAISVLHAAKKQNISIPTDLSIIGFNNIRYAENTAPPLTTIEQPITNIAQHSIEVLCSKIEGAEHGYRKKPLFNHHLVIRSSTCPPSI